MTDVARQHEAERDADQVIEIIGALAEFIDDLTATGHFTRRTVLHALAGSLAFQVGYCAQDGRAAELYRTLCALGADHVSLGENAKRRDEGAGRA
jgi:hypothetical protein